MPKKSALNKNNPLRRVARRLALSVVVIGEHRLLPPLRAKTPCWYTSLDFFQQLKSCLTVQPNYLKEQSLFIIFFLKCVCARKKKIIKND